MAKSRIMRSRASLTEREHCFFQYLDNLGSFSMLQAMSYGISRSEIKKFILLGILERSTDEIGITYYKVSDEYRKRFE